MILVSYPLNVGLHSIAFLHMCIEMLEVLVWLCHEPFP